MYSHLIENIISHISKLDNDYSINQLDDFVEFSQICNNAVIDTKNQKIYDAYSIYYVLAMSILKNNGIDISLVNLAMLKVYLVSKKENKKYQTYIIKNPNNGLYKIGKSVNPHSRINSTVSSATTPEIILIIKDNWELFLHKQFKHKRVKGEWFKLNNDDIKWILKRK